MNIIIDTRETLPYSFDGYITVNRSLPVGDYSLCGFEENGCIIERKSLSDFISSITQLRDNFMERCERMCQFDRAWIILEASLSRIERGNFLFSQVSPQSIIGTISKIESQYRISVVFSETHRLGELMCLNLLKQYYEKKREGVLHGNS